MAYRYYGVSALRWAILDANPKYKTEFDIKCGSRYSSTYVKAKGTDVYHISFRAGQTAVVTVIGDGDTDLDLYVYDENGNLIDKDVDYSGESLFHC